MASPVLVTGGAAPSRGTTWKTGAMFVVVGVTGGIAAYKTVGLVRLLVKSGHDVHVVPTDDALRFVGLPTWEALSRLVAATTMRGGTPVRAGCTTCRSWRSRSCLSFRVKRKMPKYASLRIIRTSPAGGKLAN